MSYAFPVTDSFEARDVTELDFPIEPQLYVNLDSVRPSDYLEDIKFNLNISDDRLEKPSSKYVKIVFSGHQGCGKSTELARFHTYIDHPQRYDGMLIEIEKETEVGLFQAEDLFILMVSKLVERLDALGVRSKPLEDVLQDWLSDEELKKELKTQYQIEVGSQADAGLSAIFIKLKSRFKSLFSFKSVTSRVIREKVRKNPMDLINRFNLALSDARKAVRDAAKGNDLLFILDGTEKIPYDAYKQIFLNQSHLIRAIQVNAVFSVPINSYFDITNTPRASFFQACILPMVPLNDASIPVLSEIITRRIDATRFLGEGTLDYCVSLSGGCPRQLLRIVNRAIVKSRGQRIELAIARKACAELGQDMIELLDSEHIEILKRGDFLTSDPKVLELLFSLAVLKFNGHREINPLIKDYPVLR